MHIGIVACSAEGAALCYRTIAHEGAQRMGLYAHPRITMDSIPFSEYMVYIDRDDWAGVGELMLQSAETLAQAGAGILICPDNTIHKALPLIEARSPRPWLHIAAVVAEEAVRRGFHRVGITGTKWLVTSEVYPQQLTGRGLAFVRPSDTEREEINRIIMEELVCGVFKPEAVEYFQKTMERMKGEGCDAVVLGCTEIPLIMHDGNSPLPTLDSTRLLARAAVEQAIGNRKAADSG
ncbi:MAG: amino acid racemase [Acidobacteriaceae bacterium]